MYKIIESKIKTAWGHEVNYAHRLGTTDSMTAESVLKYDEYASKSFTYKKGDIFVDIGSHIGTWGLLMASLDPSYIVHCFEPIPENCEVIKKTIAINHFKNMFVYNVAISDTSEGTTRIYYTPDDTDFGKAHKFIGSADGGSREFIDVQNMSLNDVFNIVGDNNVRVMKLDCEGCELKGFASLKPENLEKIDIVVGEFHPRNNNTKSFFNLFNGRFDNISNYPHEEEIRNMQNFAFKRKGVEK